MTKLFVVALLCSIASVTHAAVVYLPVQYEYGSGADRYYYGGNDPHVFARADRTRAIRQTTRAGNVSDTKPQVYSDALPYQPNAAVYGVTPSHARNEAYNAVPRYFRMTDVLLSGRMERDGTIIIPPTTPGTIEIRPYVRPIVAPRPRPVLIIPKSLMTPKPDKRVASAD